ncbi:hypothetical protein QQ045_022228 [Rhodiola kirilowii]
MTLCAYTSLYIYNVIIEKRQLEVRMVDNTVTDYSGLDLKLTYEGEASDKCRKEKRKTLNGDDICWALGSLGFDNFADTTKRYLLRYRDLESERAANHINMAGDNEQNDIETPTNNPVVSDNTTATINFI